MEPTSDFEKYKCFNKNINKIEFINADKYVSLIFHCENNETIVYKFDILQNCCEKIGVKYYNSNDTDKRNLIYYYLNKPKVINSNLIVFDSNYENFQICMKYNSKDKYGYFYNGIVIDLFDKNNTLKYKFVFYSNHNGYYPHCFKLLSNNNLLLKQFL